MNDKYQEVIEAITKAALESSAISAMLLLSEGIRKSPKEIAHDVICGMLYQLMKVDDHTSVAITAEIEPVNDTVDGCKTTIQYDYLHPDLQHAMRSGLDMLDKQNSRPASYN